MYRLRKKTAILLIAIFIISIFAIAMPVEAQVTWTVDNAAGSTAQFSTIQAAINFAGSGDIVLVYPGTYDENLVIDKALTVESAEGAEETIIDGSSTYIVLILSSDVTFEGFTVTNPENQGGGDISGILIGGYCYTPIPENVQILNNIVTRVRSETGTPSSFATTGINVGTSKNVIVSGNTITDIKNPGDPVGSSDEDHTCGINVWGDPVTGSSRNIEISNNIISDIKYNGIILEGAIDIQIQNNQITACESGVRVKPREGEITNVKIEGNSITDCKYGVSVVPEANDLSNLQIHQNNLEGNSEYEVLSEIDYTIDATLNWWGTPELNEIALKKIGHVLFEPWLDAPHPNGKATYAGKTIIRAPVFYPIVSLQLTDTSIIFGEVTIGGWSKTETIGVQHTGSPEIYEKITSQLIDDSVGFYDKCLQLTIVPFDLGDPFTPGGLIEEQIKPSEELTVYLTLKVDSSQLPGTYEGTLVFWAEAGDTYYPT